MFVERLDGAIVESQALGDAVYDVVIEYPPLQPRAKLARQVTAAGAELAADSDEAHGICPHFFVLLHTRESNTSQIKVDRVLGYCLDRPLGRNPCSRNSAVESISWSRSIAMLGASSANRCHASCRMRPEIAIRATTSLSTSWRNSPLALPSSMSSARICQARAGPDSSQR